jgi:hypothetical protein
MLSILQRDAARAAAEPCALRLLVDATSATALRQVVMAAGGDDVRFLRIDACAQDGQLAALLCVEGVAAAALMQRVAQVLPDCEWTVCSGRRSWDRRSLTASRVAVRHG